MSEEDRECLLLSMQVLQQLVAGAATLHGTESVASSFQQNLWSKLVGLASRERGLSIAAEALCIFGILAENVMTEDESDSRY